MICRGGIVVGGWGDIRTPEHEQFASCLHPLDSIGRTSTAPNWMAMSASVIVLALGIAFVPGIGAIPPLIESDYCYLLIAADRLVGGHGLSSLQPVAPFQAWEWQYDWGFLTQWPAGYPLLIAGMRLLLGCTAIEACRIVSFLACAGALVGWFTFIRRSVPTGVAGVFLAVVAAGSCLSAGLFINPSTDLILIAALPFILLLVCEGPNRSQLSRGGTIQLISAGLLAGGLFWFRYASVFVPVGVIIFMLIEYRRKRVPITPVAAFGFSAGAPIIALIVTNMILSPATGATEQFNLGSRMGFDFSPDNLVRAWWTFTDLGFYGYKPWVHWLFALAPILMPLSLFAPNARKAMLSWFQAPALRLALVIVGCMLGMIVAAKTVFGAKFDYVGLERYYLPARPLVLLLFVSPLLLIPRRAMRAAVCGLLVLAASWTGFHDWGPAWARWSQSARPSAPSGAWSRIFEPDAAETYEWVRENGSDPSKLIFSNFHEYLAMETGVAVLPIPQSADSLVQLKLRASAIRGIDHVEPLFVLNSENLWREYWIADVTDIIADFELQPLTTVPPALQQIVFVPRIGSSVPDNHLTSISCN